MYVHVVSAATTMSPKYGSRKTRLSQERWFGLRNFFLVSEEEDCVFAQSRPDMGPGGRGKR